MPAGQAKKSYTHRLVDVGGDHDVLVGEAINAAILKPGEVGDTLTLPDVGWSYAG